jgi:hypothetical protein
MALKLGKVPLPILDIVLGPLQARALIAAERTGVLEELGRGPASAQEIAQRRGLDAECTQLVLRVIRALGYLDQDGARFRFSAVGEAYFGAEARESYRAFVGYGGPQWDMIENLEEVLRTGRGVDFHEHHTPEEWTAYQRAMIENAKAFAWFVVDHFPVARGAKQILDVAGSHGFVGASVCRHHPGLRALVIERTEALATSRKIAADGGWSDVVTHQEGDLRTDELGEQRDGVLLCNILHHFSSAENQQILARVRRSLRPGASVGIFDIETPEDAAKADAVGDGFALYFRVTSTSACFRGADYVAWLKAAGFENARVIRSVRMPSRMLVVAEAP